MNKHQKYMAEAIKEAQKGIKLNHGGPFGTVIVKNGKIIAKAHNTVVKDHDPTCHGEMNAIRLACKKLKTFNLTGCILYTTGFPCPMCMGACKWAHIKEVFYGCDEDDTASIGFSDKKFYTWMLKATQVEHTPCLKLYKQYKALKKKTHY